jgi:N-acyl homoserine lactone hydrolase
MRMYLLSGGRLLMPRVAYYPGVPAEDWLEMPVSCALFRHAQGVALFDTGCHPDAGEDGNHRWGTSAASSTKPIFRPEEAVISQLPKAGLLPGDVDLVICSHLHYDHCGCNTFFERATVICQAKELAAARAQGAEQRGFLRREWDVGGPIQAIDGEYDVFGDGRLTLVPLPGHTPGSMGAHAVMDREGSFLLASDAAPVAASLANRTVPKSTWDPATYLRSLDEIALHAAEGTTVLFGHDRDQWASVRQGCQYYD